MVKPPYQSGVVPAPDKLPVSVVETFQGYGLFADRDIRIHEPVAYYGGPLAYQENLANEQRAYSISVTDTVAMNSHPDTIGAFRSGGVLALGALANSDHGSDKKANTKFSTSIKGNVVTISLKAKRNIKANEQILVSYGKGYNHWGEGYPWTDAKAKKLGIPLNDHSPASAPIDQRKTDLETRMAKDDNMVLLALQGKTKEPLLFPNYQSRVPGDERIGLTIGGIIPNPDLYAQERLSWALFRIFEEKGGKKDPGDYYLWPEERSVLRWYLGYPREGNQKAILYMTKTLDSPTLPEPQTVEDESEKADILDQFYEYSALYKPGGTVTVMQLNDKECTVQCGQCVARSKSTGKQCKNTTCDRLPLCWVHFKHILGLVVGDSEIPQEGKGLFTVWGRKKDDELVPPFVNPSGKAYPSEQYRALFPNRIETDSVKMKLDRKNWIIDPTCIRFVWRYVNHSEDNNCDLAAIDGELAVAIYANRDIEPGEEITVNYGKTPPLNTQYKKRRVKKSDINWDDSNHTDPYRTDWR